MKTFLHTLPLLFIFFIFSNKSFSQLTTIATDIRGDGSTANLLDGTSFAYQYDQTSDSITFVITCSSISSIQTRAFGVNVMVNIPGATGPFNFWGQDNSNAFHRLLTTWVTGVAPSAYSGTIGIADATGVNANNYTNLSGNNIDINVDQVNGTITLRLKRVDLVPDVFFTTNTLSMVTAAAVGSNQFWNDDIYSPTGMMTITRPMTNPILVTGITVQGTAGVNTITTQGGTLQMQATVLPANATDRSVTWSVQNGTGSATISPTGLLTAVSDGTVTVTATANDGSNITGSQVITLSNQNPLILVNSISVNGQGGASGISTMGGTLQMEETVLPANATNKAVSWSIVQGTNLARISNTGLVTAIRDGRATIRATAQDGSGITGDFRIVISNQGILITSIAVRGQRNINSIVDPGGTLQMETSIRPGSATNQQVLWSVENVSGSASISQNGVLQAIADGSVRVTATAKDGSGVRGSAMVEIYNQALSMDDLRVEDIRISPNPAQHILNLSLYTLPTEKLEARIYSIQGRLVHTYPIRNQESRINVGSLPEGLYYLHIHSNQGRIVKSFLKN